jgi:hypothetical protein
MIPYRKSLIFAGPAHSGTLRSRSVIGSKGRSRLASAAVMGAVGLAIGAVTIPFAAKASSPLTALSGQHFPGEEGRVSGL